MNHLERDRPLDRLTVSVSKKPYECSVCLDEPSYLICEVSIPGRHIHIYRDLRDVACFHVLLNSS